MTPLLILLVIAVVQFGVWLHTVHTAQAIAFETLQTTRVSHGSADAGRRQAAVLLEAAGHGVVVQPHVEVERDAQRVRVLIHAKAQQILPFLTLPVNVSAAGPVERVTTAD